ncbi:cysteine hydrolase family protein [Nocardia sp. NBC_00511]|uniref:cysteine hydrolase family protein n=1 Tax=Nocardia sp. NBC_00511 TaxID=2903591 RepID=UPI0030E4544B
MTDTDFPVIRPSTLIASKTGVLLIDFQNEHFTGALPVPGAERALANAKRLVSHAHKERMSVFYVRHLAPKDSTAFAEGTSGAEFHPNLQPSSRDHIVTKSQVSAFESTDLGEQLGRAGVNHLLVCGLTTDAEVASSTLDAVKQGFAVATVVGDACAARATTGESGTTIDSDTTHKTALGTMPSIGVPVMTTQEILALPVSVS